MLQRAGLAALAAQLTKSKQLQQLELDLSGCNRITTAGIAGLAAHLPDADQRQPVCCDFPELRFEVTARGSP